MDKKPAVAFPVNGDGFLHVAGGFLPSFPCVLLAHVHDFVSILSIGNEHSHAGMRVLFISHTGEADGVRVVKVVILFPESMVFTDFQQIVDDGAVHGRVAAHTVIVPVEDAGIAFLHEQDERIGGGLEPVFHS